MPAQETPVLIVAGPTASGKSTAAAMLGRMLGGEVINADSMQVYRDLRVLTARPSAHEQATVRHHFYGHVDGSERYSVGRFVKETVPVIKALQADGTVPILCGGTGLYLKALVEGLSPVPEVREAYVARGNALWDQDPAAFRHAVIEHDPPMERLDAGDRQRHVRAWSVMQATGTPLSAWQERPREQRLEATFIPGVLIPPREVLYASCDGRLARMLTQGAVDEVRALMARKLSPDLPVMKALGVGEIAAMIRGELTEEEALDHAAQETRRFAKRQMTWFRNQADWPVYASADRLVEALAKKVMAQR